MACGRRAGGGGWEGPGPECGARRLDSGAAGLGKQEEHILVDDTVVSTAVRVNLGMGDATRSSAGGRPGHGV